jgi:hypothetical protein
VLGGEVVRHHALILLDKPTSLPTNRKRKEGEIFGFSETNLRICFSVFEIGSSATPHLPPLGEDGGQSEASLAAPMRRTNPHLRPNDPSAGTARGCSSCSSCTLQRVVFRHRSSAPPKKGQREGLVPEPGPASAATGNAWGLGRFRTTAE